jgi:predicted nucleic acid-binding protein
VAYYIDTSALLKLVIAEPETPALREWITATVPVLVSSDLARTEVLRATRRVDPERMVRAREVLDSLIVMTLVTEAFELAGLLDPTILRTLDAIHVAAALALKHDLEGMVVYDDRLAQAARSNGITVIRPS